MKIVIVAAVGENGVIGRAGQLPWKLRSDLRHFRALTLDKPIIMGRKTYESIGRALDRRTNIVVTRDKNFSAENVELASTFEEALALARKDAESRGADEIVVTGGRDIFAAALPLADRLEITHVHAAPEGDVTFPPIDPKIWRKDKSEDHDATQDDDASFTVATYLRR